MAKRSRRRQVQQKRDEAGCMSGLISIFDFRHGRTTRRLLSDKRTVSKNTVVADTLAPEVDMLLSSKERHVSIEDVTESENLSFDVVKTSVKELMEEEMVSEQDFTMQTYSKEVQKISKKSFNDQEISISSQDLTHNTSQYSDLEALMKEVLLIYQQRNHNDLDEGQNHRLSVIEEKLRAVEVFKNEKSSDERCEDFIDAFQMLSSNKELFLKLLQDQTSLNPNEDRTSKSKSNSLDNQPNSSKSDVPVTRKHKNFFRIRSKSKESMPLNRIVVLKPNSLNNRFKVENDVQSGKIPSHFSLIELKRRFRNAIGKEPLKSGGNEKLQKKVVEGRSGWSSPNRDHFYTEKYSKKLERLSNLHEFETQKRENDINGDTSQHISNIYLEAKKHLSEMLNNDDKDIGLMLENLPKTLGNILSFSEYKTLSPSASPRKENDHDFVTAQMRLCPREKFYSVNDRICAGNVDLEKKPKVSYEVNVNPNILVGGIPSSVMDDSPPRGAVEIEKPEHPEEIDVFCEPCSSPKSMEDKLYGKIAEVFEENEFSSPTGSLHSNNNEEPERTPSDKTGRPSPVSVLELLFSDNEISPASTTTRIVEVAIQPRCIQFKDENICSRNCIENGESAFEYVEAVLLASGLNWDEFENRWISSVQILDSTLFDEVEMFSSRPSHDQRLLFDSTNEILQEVCDCYIDFCLQLSFIKHNIQPVPKGVNLINEVWERIESRLRDNYFLSLDHLVKKDLKISRTWMDLCSDSRDVVFEIDESIFEDIMEDTLMSLFNDCVDNEA